MPPSRGLSKVEFSELQNQMDHWQNFKTGDFGQKWNSSKQIVREGQDAISPLLEILHDPTVDAETHWFTIRALGNFPNPDVIAAIAAQIGNDLHYPDRTSEQATELSTFAIETLAAMGSIAIEVLSQLLQTPHRRLLAAKALNQVRSSGVIPELIGVANDENAMVRYYAIDALGSFHNAAVTPILLTALNDPSATVRKAAVMALGRRPDLQPQHQLSQQIEKLLWDIDLGVSCQAALALGRLGAQNTIEALKRVLLSDHTPMALRIDTIRALKWYCELTRQRSHHRTKTDTSGQTTPGPTAVATPEATAPAITEASLAAFNVLIQALNRFSANQCSGDPDTNGNTQLPSQDYSQLQVAIIRVLGNLPPSAMAQTATDILIKQLQNTPSAIIIQACIMALASLRHPQAFDALLPLLSHPTDAVPIHTIAALKRLDPDHSLNRVTAYINQSPGAQSNVLTLW